MQTEIQQQSNSERLTEEQMNEPNESSDESNGSIHHIKEIKKIEKANKHYTATIMINGLKKRIHN